MRDFTRARFAARLDDGSASAKFQRRVPAFEPIPRAFYARPAAQVAKDCIGAVLVFETSTELLTGRIVEAEAYLGPEDRAAHCFGGRRTPRNEVMYGSPGHAYVFFIYGMHFHLNLVTDSAGHPSAVLIRAVEPRLGAETMLRRRKFPKPGKLVTNGPGKLCAAFGITREQNGADLCRAPLYLTIGEAPRRVIACPRIGVDYAGSWARRRLRFLDGDSEFLSVKPPNQRRR